MIKTIVFDLGGVLIDWNPRYLYRKIFDDERAMEHFLTEVANMDWNVQQDAGRTWAEGTRQLSAQFPEHTAAIRAYADRWVEMLGGPIEGTVDILRDLKDGGQYPLYALTNWSAETFPYAQERYGFLQTFEGILVSGEEGMIKPARKIYELLLDRFNIEAATSVFIDDSLKNVKGAEAVGMQAIHFQSPTQLRADLRQLGVAC